MIGYSLGGLILRYAIGVLGEKGVFEDVIPDVSIYTSIIYWSN